MMQTYLLSVLKFYITMGIYFPLWLAQATSAFEGKIFSSEIWGYNKYSHANHALKETYILRRCSYATEMYMNNVLKY